MSQKNVYKWCKAFKEGRERADDLERSVRLSTRQLSERVSAQKMVGISERSVKTILKDHLGLREVKSCLVPKTLNFLEKSRHIDVCETMLSDY